MADLIEKSPILSKLTMCINQSEGDWDDGYNTGIAEAMQYVKNAPAVNRWIPVEDDLPEFDTMVIVCYYGSDCICPMQGETVTEAIARQNKVPTVTMGFLDEEGWNGADMFPMMVRPTFWMNLPDAPLPEPPESEVQDD